jgi:predicted RNase H-like HicB family nuclease
MKLPYRILLEPDDNGTFLVTCPALPEVTTFGKNRRDVAVRAGDAIEEALAARISDGQNVPLPEDQAPACRCSLARSAREDASVRRLRHWRRQRRRRDGLRPWFRLCCYMLRRRRWRRGSSGGSQFATRFLGSDGGEFLRLRARLIFLNQHVALFGHATLSYLARGSISISGSGKADQTAASERDARQVRLLHVASIDRAIHLELLIGNRIATRSHAVGAQIDHVRRAP